MHFAGRNELKCTCGSGLRLVKYKSTLGDSVRSDGDYRYEYAYALYRCPICGRQIDIRIEFFNDHLCVWSNIKEKGKEDDEK